MDEKNIGVVGPLNFSQQCGEFIQCELYPSIAIQCLFCDKYFKFYDEKSDYLTHLYLKHRLIIGDEDEVAIFHEYLTYWRDVFGGEDTKISEFCTPMVMDQLPDGTPSKNELYFLLCDVSPRDNEIRQKLQKKRLEIALEQHKFERIDNNFERNCLFCRDIIKSERSHFIEHLFSKHFMQLGKPENLVFIDDLIDTVKSKLDNLICLYCEKKFKDRPTLKEHMRKKGHKRINPDNKHYDRFFLIHYKNSSTVSINHQQRKTGQSKHQNYFKKYGEKKENNDSESIFENDSDSTWSDWEGDNQDVICLYCSQKNTDFNKIKEHMSIEHGVDFDRETAKMTFYDRVKIVNFVRRKMHTCECVTCFTRFKNLSDLQQHLKIENHYSLGNDKDWNLPQFFFSTYEDDPFLCYLDDDDNIDDDSCITISETESKVPVYSEDRKLTINIDAEALSKEQLNIIHK